VQQGLTLSAAAVQVARRTMFDELGDMPVHGFPSFNFSRLHVYPQTIKTG
jgi:hypothetical protein